MKAAIAVLISVAQELAELAKNSLMKIREGEKIKKEWYKNGIYYRESIFEGKVYQAQFDFRKRQSHLLMLNLLKCSN